MRTSLDFYGYVPQGLQTILKEVRDWIDSLPGAPVSIQKDGLWSCHGLSRAVCQKWHLDRTGWQVCDGYFIRSYQHSWLAMQLSERTKLIIDVYPVASKNGPLLVDASRPSSPWSDLYIDAPDRYKDMQQQFEAEVTALLAA